MKKNNLILGLCLLVGALTGCSDDVDTINIKKVLAQEQKNIEAYLEKNAKTEITKIPVSVASQHVADMYVFNNDLTGTVPENKDWVLVNYDLTNLNNYIFDTTDPAKAAGVGSGFKPTFTFGGPIYAKVGDGSFLGILAGYVAQDKKGNLLVPSPVLYSNGITHLYELKVEKIAGKDLFAYENGMIKRYRDKIIEEKSISQENVLNVKGGKDTTTYVLRTKVVPEGESISVKDSVSVVCSAFILDEVNEKLRQIAKPDGNKSVKWKLSEMIDGIKLGIPELKVGEEAVIIVPYGMAYNEKLFRGIPPYSTLIYEIKITDRVVK